MNHKFSIYSHICISNESMKRGHSFKTQNQIDFSLFLD